MKLTLKHWFLAFLSAVFIAAAVFAFVPVIAASAEGENITCETATGNYLNDDYIAVYKVPTNMLAYEANGGGTIANAFDGNWNSYWQTATENNGQQNDNPTFLNAITVTFSQSVTIESIVYASSSARLGHGYPVTLNVYTANGGDLSLYGTCNSTATNDRVIFRFKEAITVTQIKFEFRKVNTAHNWTATAKEICFLQPDNANANKVLDLFEDYAQYSVKNEYKSSLSEIRSGVTNLISYQSALKPLLDRAEAIVGGTLKKDSRREFSTDPKAQNVINRYGDLRSYAGNTLKMSSFGIDRQVLGIGGLKGDTITVYVEAEAGDPLPTIAFTQVKGDWRSWQSSYRLSLGKNVLTFPDFITGDYSWQVTPGGPIHIINPYEPSQQSSNVKVYVEGGFFYPVFRKGGDVNAFIEELTSYNDAMQTTEGMSDVAELVGDHFLHTVSAKRAYNDFVTRKVNPQKNAESWDDYVSALLEFDGVALSPEGEHFDEKNLHLYTNFRVVQPWGGAGAFAAGDHIGFISFGEDVMTSFGTPGWGVAHEIGHALDVNGRTIGETTNNMWAKFELAYLSHNVSRNFNADTTKALTPDDTYTQGFFNTNRYNYQLWWNLEACYHGFWGKLDNMYRYFDEAAARTQAGLTAEDGQLSQTERMVYYSSLVMGEDLGYYYERFGFSFESNDSFKVETASAAYKKLTQKALDDQKIVYKGFKYWYIDAERYFYDDWKGGCYTQSSQVEILSANKTDNGYILYLDVPDNVEAHLGYEIMEYRGGKWSVIGFSQGRSYTDTTEYPEGYVPQYKLRAYDRMLSSSAESAPKTYNQLKQEKVCRIGNTYYDTLSEAIAAANSDEIIYICGDLFDSSITVTKSVSLLPDPNFKKDSLIIRKSVGGVLLTVNGGVTLTIGSIDGAKIIIDGFSFSQDGALIRVNGNGKLIANNLELCNNINTDHGGAVFVNGGGAVADFTKVTFKNNSVTGNDRNGGALANFSGNVTMTDCTFIGNSTKTNGGAITVDGKLTLIRCIIKDNTAADKGGALFIACNGGDRIVTIEDCEISGNITKSDSSIAYIGRGTLIFIGGGTEKLSGEFRFGGGTVKVDKALPDFSGVTFYTPANGNDVKDGTVLLTANGDLTFTEAFVNGLNVKAADASLGNNNKTIVLTLWPTVTISVNGKEVKEQIKPGSFVLPNTVTGLDEDKYVTEWEFNGQKYSTGDTIEITGDCSLKVLTVSEKFTVTLKYGDVVLETHYVVPNGSFVFEEYEAPQGKVFSHWEIDGKSYNAGDTVVIKGDTIVMAVYDDAPAEDSKDGGKSHGWAIAITVMAIVLLLALGVAVAVIIIKKRKNSADDYDEDDYDEEYDEEDN